MDRIIKTADNRVEVTPSAIGYDVDGNEIELYRDDLTKVYGQDIIDAERIICLDSLNNFQNEEWIQQNIDARQAESDKLDIIQEVMDGEENKQMSSGVPIMPKGGKVVL